MSQTVEQAPYMPPLTNEQLGTIFQAAFMAVKQNAERQKVIWMDITPDMAESLQVHWMTSKQRKLRKANLETLISALQKDELLNNNPLWVCFVRNSDGTTTKTIINAQHTLEAIIQTGVTFRMLVIMDPCNSNEEVYEKYAKFDVGASRNQNDITRMIAPKIFLNDGHEEDDTPVPFTDAQIKTAVESMTWISNGLGASGGFGHVVLSKLDKAEMILDDKYRNHLVEIHRVIGEFDDENLPEMQRALWKKFYKTINVGPVIAVLIVSMMARPVETLKILSEVVSLAKDGDGSEYVQDLFDTINAGHCDKYGGKGSALFVWRMAYAVNSTINGEASKRQIARKQRVYNDKPKELFKESWKLACGGLIAAPVPPTNDLDMKAAKERKARLGTGDLYVFKGEVED